MEAPQSQLEILSRLLEGAYGRTATLLGFFIVTLYAINKYNLVFLQIHKALKTFFEYLLKMFDKLFSLLTGKRKENNSQLIINDIKFDIDKCFSPLDVRMAEIKNVRTDDFVKDQLLVDMAEDVFVSVKEVINEFVESYSNDKEIKTLVSKLKISVNEIINRYLQKWKERGVPNTLIRKVTSIFEAEEKVFLESFELFANADDNPKRLVVDVELICAHYSSVMRLFENQIKQMNGDLNGMEYSNKIIGLYNSLGDLKVNRFPLPLGIKETDVSDILDNSLKSLKADYVGLIDIYESPKDSTSTLDRLARSKFSVSYTNNEKVFPYKTYINKTVISVVNEDELSRLINNEIFFIDRSDLYEWSGVRKFMSVNEIESMIVQPILSGKESLIGCVVYLYRTQFNETLKPSLKNYLHTVSPKCVKLLRHNL